MDSLHQSTALGTGLEAAHASAAQATLGTSKQAAAEQSSLISAKDGVKLFVQDWGSGQPIVFLAAWTLDSNVWGSHIAALTAQGFRCIAPDRRGHGRSDAPGIGYDLDTLAEDLAAIIEFLDLTNVVLVAHSLGSIEAVRYCVGYGSKRITRLVLVAPPTPYLTKTDDNPDAVPRTAIEAHLKAITKNFPKWIADNEGSFFERDTPSETRSWIKNMMLKVPLPIALACQKTIAAADLRADLKKIACPTLIVQGDKDASVALEITGAKTAQLIENSKLVVYRGATHALILNRQEQFIADVMDFINECEAH
ncbi:MAG TPA: alpha/beta hydrolase [Gammaproteobacteria bacterium]|nr:alpha/beta hydrolase [Gammaproteobacteria bacterium]